MGKLYVWAIIIGLFILAVFIGKKMIDAKKKEALIKSGIDLANREGLNDGDETKIISRIKKDKLKGEKTIVDNTPVVEISDAIYEAKGNFNDDEDAVYTALGRIKSKAALSYVNIYFKSLYKISLIGYLQKFLDASELGRVNEILKKLN